MTTIPRPFLYVTLACLLQQTETNPPLLASEIMPYEQAVVLTRAVGRINAKQQSTHVLLRECSHQFSGLRLAADDAQERWQKRNADMIDLTLKMQNRLIHQFKTKPVADEFSAQINSIVHNHVQSLRTKLESYSTENRQSVCERLIVAITGGEWDIQRSYAQESQLIRDYLQQHKTP